MSRPLGSTPTPASRNLTATTGRSASERRNWYSMPWFLPRHAPSRDLGGLRPRTPYRRSPSHVPCKSRRPGSRRLYAGHRLANTRAPARLISKGKTGPPILMSTENPFDASTTTPNQKQPWPGDSGTSSWSPPDAIKSRRIPDRSPRRSSANAASGWFSARPRRTDAGAPTSLHLSHSTAYERCLLHRLLLSVRDTRLRGSSAATSGCL